MNQKKVFSKEQMQGDELSLRRLLRRLFRYLSRKRRLQLSALFLVMIASSVSEVLSLTAVLPFLVSS